MDNRRLVRVLKALADPTRLRMVQEIASEGELSCGQVAEHFDVSQPTISHHLKVLSDAGVLLRRSHGKHHFLSVDQTLIRAVGAALRAQPGPNSAASRKR